MRAPTTFVESYLHAPEKLEKLDPRLQKIFWSAREWHPVVKMSWLALIDSDGKGLITYADGSQRTYELSR